MSTRSVISVIDDSGMFHIYRHSDGYPSGEHGVLDTLAQALPLAWALPRYEAMDFAAAIVAAWKQPGGGNIYLTTGPEAHGDLSYRYEVRCVAGLIRVTTFEPIYDGGFDVVGWKRVGKRHTINLPYRKA